MGNQVVPQAVKLLHFVREPRRCMGQWAMIGPHLVNNVVDVIVLHDAIIWPHLQEMTLL